MALALYIGSGSPYSWRVQLALEYKRIPHEIRLLSFFQGDLVTPAYTAINPRQRVPSLVDDEFKLYESAAILEYLDERFPEEPRLFPGDVRERALVRRRVRESDEYFGLHVEALVTEIFYEPNSAQRNRARIEKTRAELESELQRIEASFGGEFLAGPLLTAADFTLYPYLAMFPRFQLREPGLGLTHLPGERTRAWMQRIEALPYFDKTYPPHWRAAPDPG